MNSELYIFSTAGISGFGAALGVILVGYLLGAIPFAVIIAKSQGVDIFKAGSGNPGATNVKRVLGKRLGNTVFALDCLKGFLAAFWPALLLSSESAGLPLGVWGLVAAVLGHSFSVFLRFRGGKGVATTMGGLLALVPWVLFLGIFVWLICFFSTRVVALASIGFGVSLPVGGLLFREGLAMTLFLAVIAAVVVVRHRSNIQRLLAGTENSFK